MVDVAKELPPHSHPGWITTPHPVQWEPMCLEGQLRNVGTESNIQQNSEELENKNSKPIQCILRAIVQESKEKTILKPTTNNCGFNEKFLSMLPICLVSFLTMLG